MPRARHRAQHPGAAGGGHCSARSPAQRPDLGPRTSALSALARRDPQSCAFRSCAGVGNASLVAPGRRGAAACGRARRGEGAAASARNGETGPEFVLTALCALCVLETDVEPQYRALCIAPKVCTTYLTRKKQSACNVIRRCRMSQNQGTPC